MAHCASCARSMSVAGTILFVSILLLLVLVDRLHMSWQHLIAAEKVLAHSHAIGESLAKVCPKTTSLESVDTSPQPDAVSWHFQRKHQRRLLFACASSGTRCGCRHPPRGVDMSHSRAKLRTPTTTQRSSSEIRDGCTCPQSCASFLRLLARK